MNLSGDLMIAGEDEGNKPFCFLRKWVNKRIVFPLRY